ncbi:hypothetical protein, partial [Streptomyces zhihengii]
RFVARTESPGNVRSDVREMNTSDGVLCSIVIERDPGRAGDHGGKPQAAAESLDSDVRSWFFVCGSVGWE